MKIKSLLLASCLSLLSCLVLTNCSGIDGRQSANKVSYKTGFDAQNRYNIDNYFYNDERVYYIADPEVIYVDKKDDPVYGGYFYMYGSSNVMSGATYTGDSSVSYYAFPAYRSTNLNDWELCGALRGMTYAVYPDDWVYNNAGDHYTVAPEVIRNPNDGLYYMYFSGASNVGTEQTEYSDEENKYARCYVGLAVSSSPCGPFTLVHNVQNADGKLITKQTPLINFQKHFNLKYNFSVIDVSPFLDDDGTLYLYFNKHIDTGAMYPSGYSVWGIRMKDWFTPDYTSLSVLTAVNRTTVSGPVGQLSDDRSGTGFTFGPETDFNEGNSINEGPYMYKRNGKYYLLYSSDGYSSRAYSIQQAISDNPLGGFTKVSRTAGNPVLSSQDFSWVAATGHGCVLDVGDETFVIYAKWGNHIGLRNGWYRVIGVERVKFVKNQLGQDVMTSNGPSKGLQWVPEKYATNKNIAKEAIISTSSGENKNYLNDEILPVNTIVRDNYFSISKNTKITYSFNKPTLVSSIMIYNSREYDTSFKKISSICFNNNGEKSYIYDLMFPEKYLERDEEGIPISSIACSPAVAEFDSRYVTSITITVNFSKDRLVKEDKYGYETNEIRIPEIVILGGSLYRVPSHYHSDCKAEFDEDLFELDGELNEEAWKNKNWFKTSYLNNVEGNMPKMEVATHLTEKGVYIASVAYDKHLTYTGAMSQNYNTAFNFYIAACQDNEDIGDGSERTHCTIIDLANSRTTITNYPGDVDYSSGLKIYGELSDSSMQKESEKAIVEIFYPWSTLGVDATQGIPSKVYLMPIYWGVLTGGARSNMELDPCPVYYADRMYEFDRNGYMHSDLQNPDNFIGSSKNGQAPTNYWDVDGNNATFNCRGESQIYISESYDRNFIASTYIEPKSTLGGLKAGFMIKTDSKYYIWADLRLDGNIVNTPNGKTFPSITVSTTTNFKYGQPYYFLHKDVYTGENTWIDRGPVKFTVAKQNNTLYYFVNDSLVYIDQHEWLSGECYVGLVGVDGSATFKNVQYTKSTVDDVFDYISHYGGHIITTDYIGGGFIEAEQKVVIGNNASVKIYVTPNTGYYLSSITVNGVEMVSQYDPSLGYLLIENINDNVEVIATFKKSSQEDQI